MPLRKPFSPDGKLLCSSFTPAQLRCTPCIQPTINSSHPVDIPSHHRHQLVTQVIHRKSYSKSTLKISALYTHTNLR